jgi:hypothetical protein
MVWCELNESASTGRFCYLTRTPGIARGFLVSGTIRGKLDGLRQSQDFQSFQAFVKFNTKYLIFLGRFADVYGRIGGSV